MFDIIVVGAGPAGATFSRLVGSKYKVLLIDKAGKREKCCGGLIAPDAQAILASFDLGIPKSIISDPQLLYVRSLDLESNRERNYQRYYTNVNRKLLDEYTVRQLPSNVTVKKNCRYIKHTIEGNEISVIVESGELTEAYRCKILVGADGANSRVRRELFDDFGSIRKYLAIQGAYRKASPINHYAVFFDRKITDFYSWLIPKDDLVLVGGAFRENEKPRLKFDMLITAVRNKKYEIGELVRINACYLLRPRLRDIKLGKSGTALIGEAAGFISPSSSEGLSYAYRSARALAKALDENDDDWQRRYRRNTSLLKANICIKILKSKFMYNHIIRNLIFILKIGSLERI